MVAILEKHDTKWVTASPLWAEFSDISNKTIRETFNRPAILRFNNDKFMDELMSLMEYYPERLVDWVAQPETWREPMPTPDILAKLDISAPLSQFKQTQTRQLKLLKPAANIVSSTATVSVTQTAEKPLKLYQPAHQRFYLVTASLVCRQIGLPDRFVDLAKQQKVEFVIRRLLPKTPDTATPDVCDPTQCDEYAYIATDKGGRWQKVKQGSITSEKTLIEGEERLPMFNLAYEETEEKTRKMLAGFIPVGKREAFLNAALDEGDANTDVTGDATTALSTKTRDAITHLFNQQVAGPWKSAMSLSFTQEGNQLDWNANKPEVAKDFTPDPGFDPFGDNIKVAREKIQTASWYVLVDMLNFFKDYMPNVYDYIANGVVPAELSTEEEILYDVLATITINTGAGAYGGDFINSAYHTSAQLIGSLITALKFIIDNSGVETTLDLVEHEYDRKTKNTQVLNTWPDFLFPLADPVLDNAMPFPLLTIDEPSDDEPDISHDQIDAITELVRQAIPLDTTSIAPDIVEFTNIKADRRDGWFQIRCVFESPNCGAIQLPIVSEATIPFKMASFFDPDAPGRPITIPMPLDISPAGLRKFNKNASFMISDMLCGKLKKMRKYTLADLVLSVLPWPLNKSLSDPGDTGKCSKGGTGFGMICSFSIPIVTLCAMILLIIMVTLFDLFFRWLPYLFLCLPIPGLKGKKDA